jgi:hypothetical protein
MGINLIKNPGLEQGDNGLWSFFSGCTLPGGNIIADPANARTGNFRMMVRGGKAGPGTQTCGRWSQVVDVQRGFLHRFSVFYKVPTLGVGIQGELQLKGLQSSSTYLDTVISVARPDYTQIGPFEFDPIIHGDTQMEIVALINPPLGNPGFSDLFFDDFSLEQITFPRQGIRGFVAG